MAALEWARLGAYHALDADTLCSDLLHKLTPEILETLCFSMHPALTVISSRWPVGSIWQVTTEGGDGLQVNMKQAEEVLVVRPLLNVETHILPADGAMLLNRLRSGLTLPVAADQVMQVFPGFNPGNHLYGLLNLGAFTHTYHQGENQ